MRLKKRVYCFYIQAWIRFRRCAFASTFTCNTPTDQQKHTVYVYLCRAIIPMLKQTPISHNVRTTGGGEVNNTDHLDAIQCSAGIPWLLEFMWMHFNTVCRRSTLPCSKRTPCWQLPLQQDKVHFCTKKKLPRNGWRIVTKSSRCPPGLQVPHIPIHSSICGTC